MVPRLYLVDATNFHLPLLSSTTKKNEVDSENVTADNSYLIRIYRRVVSDYSCSFSFLI